MPARFFYDIVCPYAYLASTQINKLAAETQTEIEWVPMLLGGVFRAQQAPQVPAAHMSPAKARMNTLDLERWARRWDVPFSFSAHHPQRSVEAMRLLCITPPSLRPQVSAALFNLYWVEQKRLDQSALEEVAIQFNLLEYWLQNRDKAKHLLFSNTEQAVSFGIFGAPALEIDGRIFWGQDRLDLARIALGGESEAIISGSAPKGCSVEVFHDFASPFSYLGCQHVARLLAERGAEVVWKPMLLGALFKSLKGPMVPLFEMNAAKRTYMGKDLLDWSSYWKVPFGFPKAFPMNTVTALRLAIIKPDLTLPLYRAAWAEGHDLGDPQVLHTVVSQNGYDAAALLVETQNDQVKAILRANTQEAEDRGAFGAPSYLLQRPNEAPQLFWGQDRLRLLCEALVAPSSS